MANQGLAASDLSAGFTVTLTAEQTPSYHIIGTEMQIVNILLKPSQAVEVSPGAMMHHGPSIYANPRCSCSCGRFCTGESNVLIHYTNKGSQDEVIGLSPVYPAKIIPIHLSEGSVIVRATSYMCGVGDVNISMSCDCCSLTCCFGNMGMVRQRISGDGLCFLQAGGTVLEKTLGDGEEIVVDQESLIGWQETVKYGVRPFAGACACCSLVWGGEGCCMGTLRGPGKIYITSMNFSKWRRVLAPSLSGQPGVADPTEESA